VPELREPQSVTYRKSGLRIRPVMGRTLLRVKTWTSGMSGTSKLRPSGVTGVPPGQRFAIAGVELPARVGATVPGELSVLCTGPSDWLLVARQALSWPARGSIEADCAGQSLALVDLSSGLSVIEIEGGRARDLLSKGCGLDLDRSAFAYPRCARTRFAQLAVVVEALEDQDSLDLYVAASHAHYLNEWLNHGALEFCA
jgi:heterotetrameric sarcosine oxidase gamma subunit